jgi:hypothetical protein
MLFTEIVAGPLTSGGTLTLSGDPNELAHPFQVALATHAFLD